MSGDWTFFSNHGLVLVALARRPDLRLRELAEAIDITERAAQHIVNDLVDGGFVERTRVGRRNTYLIRGDRALRHPSLSDHDVADLVQALVAAQRTPPSTLQLEAVVVACSDHRFQEPLRRLLAAQGILDRSELIAWPGGGSALGGPDGPRIIEAIRLALGGAGASRLLLVAHQDCRVPGAFIRGRRDLLGTPRAVMRRRKKAVDSVRKRLGLEPELWFLDARGAFRVHVPTPMAGRSGPHDDERVAS